MENENIEMNDFDVEEIQSTSDAVEKTSNGKKVGFFEKIKNYFVPKGIHLEMLRYKPNKASFNIGILGFVFLCLGYCIFYSSTNIPIGKVEGFKLLGSTEPGYFLGIDILFNILIMLFMLYSCIRMKAYYISQGAVSIGLGVFDLVRTFFLPLALRRCNVMTPIIYTCVTIFYIISGACSIIAGLLSVCKGSLLKKYLLSLKESE